jgi:glycosyltransferase involved in cell wall biosynthesis
MALRLTARGHQVAVLTLPDEPNSARWLVRRGRRKLFRLASVQQSDDLGYPVFRSIDPREGMTVVRERFPLDIVIANVARGSSAQRFTRAVLASSDGLPSIAWLRDVEGIELFDLDPPAVTGVFANADHLAKDARRRGLDVVVIPSVVDLAAYRTATSRHRVLFVNPVAAKGVSRAWALAEGRPDIPFTFRRGWPLSAVDEAALVQRAAGLANVELRPVCHIPHELYADARVLLASHPSEGRPRVVLEAQVNGIPVLGADSPGVREAVGPGGLLIPFDAPDADWFEALSRLWDDAATYERLAEAARLHSLRPEVDPDTICDRFEQVVARLVKC